MRVKHRRLHAIRRHIARLERRLQWLDTISHKYSRARSTLVLVGLAAIFLGSRLFGDAVGWSIAGVLLAVFFGVASYHGRVKDSITRYTIWHRIKTARVARMTLDWAHMPRSSDTLPDTSHPFAADLNLIGERSLHQLLDTTMSQEGSARLRTWLLQPALEPAQVRARQDLVRELIPLVGFRDRLALQSALVARDPQVRWEGEALRHWLERPAPQTAFRPWLLLLGGLAGGTIILGVLYALGLAPAFWIGTFALYVVLYSHQHKALGTLFIEAFHLEKTLDQFRAVLWYLETYAYGRTPALARLCAPFWQGEQRPSALLKKIARLAGAASVQQGNIVGPLVNAIVPWDLYFAYRLEQAKTEVGAHLPVWLETWYELEALNALANFGYMNPDCVFPDIVSATAGPTGSQSLSPVGWVTRCYRTTCGWATILPWSIWARSCMVTGSNMSGKSTFFRTLGVNLCLAFSGAPVHASALRTMPFRLFTCIAISDSVTDGMSYFYAEVRRLKALLAALASGPPCAVVFPDRRDFSWHQQPRAAHRQSRLRAGAGRQAMALGIVSTHDLELVKLVHTVPGGRNAHFREDVVDGRMRFDYTLRPGPCPTTNALEIMRLEGLPVATDAAGVSHVPHR